VDAEGLRKIRFVFDSIINGKRRGFWLPQPSPGPIEEGWQFETNTRGFGQFNLGNSKLFNEGWIESEDIGHAENTPRAYWVVRDVGVSTRRRLVSGKYVYQSAKATVSGGQPKVVDHCIAGTVSCDTAIRFRASAAYPFIPIAPPITYDIVFDFAVVGNNKVLVLINGFSTKFPDFEAYIDGRVVYRHESLFTGPGFGDLGPNNQTNYVTTTATVDAPTSCKCSQKPG
jgi:hypothetical protein